jgi:hypothetical protein
MRFVEQALSKQIGREKAASKTKFTCPGCGANAWGKPDLNLVCGDCDERMEAEEAGEGEGDS